MLPKEAIKEFQVLYQKRFGIDLSDQEATLRANNLVNLYKFVYGESSFGPVQKDYTSNTKQSDEKTSE